MHAFVSNCLKFYQNHNLILCVLFEEKFIRVYNSHRVKHLFLGQVFIKQLVCVSYCAGPWEQALSKANVVPISESKYFGREYRGVDNSKFYPM
jgi:hypothetical protein